jgi:hypothetical protein
MADTNSADKGKGGQRHGPGEWPHPEDDIELEQTIEAESAAEAHEEAPGRQPGRRHGRPMRTPAPSPIQGEIEDPQPSGGHAATALKERLGQLRYIQDLLHNPIPFDLRQKPLDTSTSPEELASRKAELGYQLHVLKALVTVLTEELEQLEGITIRSDGAPSQDGPDQ